MNETSSALAFQYHGVHVHHHCRTQGVILADSEHEARLLLRNQEVVALSISLISAANPLLSAQSASANLSSPLPWHWLATLLAFWTQNQHAAWRVKTLSLLATSLNQAPLLQALAVVERQLTALKTPAVWPAALLVWRDALAKGLSCAEALKPFAHVWGTDWLTWVKACEGQGMPMAPLAPWIQVEEHRQALKQLWRTTLWRCYGWGIALTALVGAGLLKNPLQATAFVTNTLGMALPVVLMGGCLFYNLKKPLEKPLGSIIKLSLAKTVGLGWAAWWIALNLKASDADNLSPLEALQLAVQIPSAQNAVFLHQALAAVEAGEPLETALSQSPYLPVADRLCFEAVQDSSGLRQAIKTCWHQAETENANRGLRWLIALDIVLTLMSLGLVLLLVAHSE